MQGGQTSKRNARTAVQGAEVDQRFVNEGFLAVTSVFFSIVSWSAASQHRHVADRSTGAEFLVTLVDSILMPLADPLEISLCLPATEQRKVLIQSGYIDTDWLPLNDPRTVMLQVAFSEAARCVENSAWCQGDLRRCKLSCFLAVLLCNPGDSKSWPSDFQGTSIQGHHRPRRPNMCEILIFLGLQACCLC